MNKFVGLDLSLTSTGFALKDEKIKLETIKTTPKTAKNDLARLLYIRDKLMSMIPEDTKLICIENFFIPFNKAQINAAKDLIMLGTVMRMTLMEKGFPFYIVANTQLKKYATGKGNGGPKGIVIREVYKKWDIDAKDDNQADACVLSYMAEALYERPDGLFQYQIDTLDKVLDEGLRYNVG
jgi:crossover junction endodeoxyribonuclease RuvC